MKIKVMVNTESMEVLTVEEYESKVKSKYIEEQMTDEYRFYDWLDENIRDYSARDFFSESGREEIRDDFRTHLEQNADEELSDDENWFQTYLELDPSKFRFK